MLQRIPIAFLIMTGWKYAGKFRPLMICTFFIFALAQVVALCEPYVIGKLLNAVQEDVSAHAVGAKIFHDCCYYLAIFFAIKMGFWLFHGPGRVLERITQFHIQVAFKSRMFQMLTELPLQWHREHHSGDSIDKINKAGTSLAAFFDSSFEVMYMLFRLVGTQIILYTFMPVAGFASTVASLISLTIIFQFDKLLVKQYAELNRFNNRVAAAVHDYITNIVSVITLRLEEPVVSEVNKRLVVSFSTFQKNIINNELKWALTSFVIVVMIVGVLLWYVHQTIDAGQVILAGTFFTLFEYLRRIGDSFYGFATVYSGIVQNATNVRGADPIFQDFEKLEIATKDFNLPEDWKRLAINGLHFTYEDEKHRTHHLEDVSIELVRGTTIALVGESGSGKSTLLNLLRGLQTAEKVEVICDGKSMPGKLAHLSHTATLMPQEPEIFADTIRTNVTFALDADELRLKDSIEMARFAQVMERLPDKFNTNIAEKGINLSGGEKQRLALARGIYFAKNSSIILLDEPTSSVDTVNERIIYERLISEYSDKCVVSAIHKLHLLELFDKVYVFEDGCLIESGSFRQLVNEGGKLASMWNNYQVTQNDLVATEDVSYS
jgi:ABC-type multidrug transport system fused ATPase/permease subunit